MFWVDDLFVVLNLGGVILGVDLMPMSTPLGRSQPRYSVVVLDEGKIVSRFENVSKRRLLRLIWTLKPSMVAIDNVYEFASSSSRLLKFLKAFPQDVKVVQVTRVFGGFKPLSMLVRDYGLADGVGKLSPIMAAELSARLASMGVGSEVEYLKNETRILVCRGRRIGEGGMSEDRYERKIRTAVYNASMNIKSILDSHGIEYDIFFNRRGFGVDRCLFIVYSPKDSLRGLVKNMNLGDVQIKVFEESSDRIIFKPLGSPESEDICGKEPLIVGLDPGVITGLAILDMDGRLVHVGSRRNWSRNDIISEVMKFGTPIIVATDVHPPSFFVVKMASIWGARVYELDRSLSVDEKRDLVYRYCKDFNLNLDLNVHERDALASAVKVFYGFKPLFSKADSSVSELGIDVPRKQLRALLIRGYSIKRAIDVLTREVKISTAVESKPEEVELEVEAESSDVVEYLKRKLSIEEEMVRNLKLQRDQLAMEVEKLKSEIDKLNSLINSLNSELNYKIKRDREVASLESRLSELQLAYQSIKSECESLKAKVDGWTKMFLKILRGEIVFLKPIKNLTLDNVRSSIESYNIRRGDVVFISDFNVFDVDSLKKLSSVGCAGIVGFSPPKHVCEAFDDFEIPFIDASSIKLEFFEGYPYVEANLLSNALNSARESLLERSSLKRRERLKKLFDEYRSMRLKELKDFDSTIKY